MKKLIIIQWDSQLGPTPIVQFPPEAQFPSKEIILKVWAHHEMDLNTSFINVMEKDQYYCSLIRKLESKTFFIILELDKEDEASIFREILERIAPDLINSINLPRFPHILSETYKTIKNYTDVDEQQLYLRLFEEKIRISVLEILRKGCITKAKLKNELQSKSGYTNFNLDLFITPLLRLDLVQVKNIPGAEDCIFLIKDFYCCRIPPPVIPKDFSLKQKYSNYFANPIIISEKEIYKYLALCGEPSVHKLVMRLSIAENPSISIKEGLLILGNNTNLYETLLKESILIRDESDKLYLLSKLYFLSFVPKYILPILAKRYENGEISMDQLIYHTEMLK